MINSISKISTLADKIMESDQISPEDYREMFKISEKAVKKSTVLADFFGKSVMGRMIDLLADNQDKAIFTPDLLEKGDISSKWFYVNIPTLIKREIVIEIKIGNRNFYKWNSTNPQAKHISKLRDILNSKINA
jgi:hypothetical protein